MKTERSVKGSEQKLVASHETIKLLKVEARRANLISIALSGKDDGGCRVRSCERFHRSRSCNKVVDMLVMVSSNRSRENESGSQC